MQTLPKHARYWIVAVAIMASHAQAEDIFTHGASISPGWESGSLARGAKSTFGRVDLDCDINYDGVITNDGTDGGDLEKTPPGFVVGPDRMGKLLFRVNPFYDPTKRQSANTNHQLNLNTGTGLEELRGAIEIKPLNLKTKNRTFANATEAAKAGHFKVWSDAKKTKLLLDTKDPTMHRVEWKLISPEAPGSVFIEYVSAAEPTALWMFIMEMNDPSRRKKNDKPYDASAPRDLLLVTPRSRSVDLRKAPDFRFANYAGFTKTDRDTEAWSPMPANGKLPNQ